MQILKDYFSAVNKVEQEYDGEELEVIDGQIPDYLNGTLFRNGNGRFEHFGVKYNHLFDGDGMITSYRFSGGKVEYSNRYVRTREWKAEQEKQKFLFRGFGTNKPGGLFRNILDMRFKNVANTSVIFHAGRLLALWEGGLPHEIDPETLETIGRYDYDGVLINDFSFLDHKIFPELPFSAHPKRGSDGVLHNFGTAGGVKNRLLHYEVDPLGKAKIAHVTELKRLNFTHDFILTAQGDKVYFLTPVQFDVLRSFAGLTTPAGSMQADKTAKIRILVFDSEYNQIELETDFAFVFHFINGYREGNTIILDGLMLSDWPSAEGMQDFLNGEVEEMAPFQPTRFELDLESRTVKKHKIINYGVEFPTHHPAYQGQKYRYAWGISAPLKNDMASPILDGLIKLDLSETSSKVYKNLAHCLPGEPIFVPRSDKEEDGLLILPVYNQREDSTEIRGYEASDLQLVFSARLPHNIPLGFHGIWEEN